MSAIDLLKHHDERKLELDIVQNEVKSLQSQIRAMRKKELLLAQRFMTVKHWVSSRKLK